jgi:hypothetical protein
MWRVVVMRTKVGGTEITVKMQIGGASFETALRASSG